MAKPTYEAARLAVWDAFGDAGWDLSSPTLKVLHATQDDDIRLWFKPRAILISQGGPPWRMSDSDTLAYNLDLREVTNPPAFVRAVEKRIALDFQ